VCLPAGELHLLRFDHHHVFAHVEVRREDGLVLATENGRDLGGESAEHAALGIHQEPFPIDRLFLRHDGRHESS
jgi:hypothetical protein